MGLLWTTLLALGGAGALIGAGRYISASRRRRQRAIYPSPASLVIDLAEDAAVTRRADGSFDLRLAEATKKVQVYVGTSPDAIDRTAPIVTAVHTDHIVMPDLPQIPRPYFELIRAGEAVIVAERALPLEGVANARDIGGYLTRDGRRVRWGQVYRTGSLAGATAADLDYLQTLGARLVCDLRSADEIGDDPNRLPESPAPRYQHLPINAGEQTGERLRALLFNPRGLQALMDDLYTHYMIEQYGETFGEALRLLADPDNLPAIIHCTAGKDRTGVTIALLLAVLGVPDDVIIADYTLSNRFYIAFRDFIASKFRQPQAFLVGLHVDDFQPLLTAHPRTMQHTLDYIRQHYETVERYLELKAGVDAATRAALRTNLLS